MHLLHDDSTGDTVSVAPNVINLNFVYEVVCMSLTADILIVCALLILERNICDEACPLGYCCWVWTIVFGLPLSVLPLGIAESCPFAIFTPVHKHGTHQNTSTLPGWFGVSSAT